MNKNPLFSNLIYDERGNLVETKYVGGEACYVVNDAGFLRHIPAEQVDRQLLQFFLEQLQGNKDLAVSEALRMLGKDDLFTKAALESSVRNANMDDILQQGIPSQALDMLGMMGFRARINHHGELIDLEQPSREEDE